jgi:cyanophycinase
MAKGTRKKTPPRKKDKENHCPTPTGILLVIGGKENQGEAAPENKEKPSDFIRLQILQRFRELLAKKDPIVEVVTTASGDGEESFEDYKKVFEEVGINRVGHFHHTSRAELADEALLDRVREADAFFFSGGDQLKLTTIYGGTPLLTLLKERYINEGVVIAGTSAGAMALSTPMIYAGNEEVQELGGNIKVTTGLEFMKDVCIDTHFVHRGRFIRMAQVIATNPSCIGIGIEEDTAILVRNGEEAEVLGTGLVLITEGFDLEGVNVEDFTSDRPVTARNLKVHLLADGDRYHIPMVNPPHK